MQKHGKKIHMYASKSCAAIYDDFRNSPEMAAHDLDTYIFTFTKIVMLSPQFSVQRPAFLKAVFQCESFDVGLIRVGESPEVRVMVHTGKKGLWFHHSCKESLVIMWTTQTFLTRN